MNEVSALACLLKDNKHQSIHYILYCDMTNKYNHQRVYGHTYDNVHSDDCCRFLFPLPGDNMVTSHNCTETTKNKTIMLTRASNDTCS